MVLAVSGVPEASSRLCPKCGAEMKYLGQRMFGTQANTEPGGISAPFYVYTCSRCFAVQLVSYDNEFVYRNFVKRDEARSKSFLKRCYVCGSSIPVASEECKFCGSKQLSWGEEKRLQKGEQTLLARLARFEEKRAGVLVREVAPVGMEVVSTVMSEATPQVEVEEGPRECMVCHGPVKEGISESEYSAMSEKVNALSKEADDLRFMIKELETLHYASKMTAEQHVKVVEKHLSQLFDINRELLPLKERMQKEAGNVVTDLVTCPHCGNVAHRAHMLEWLHVKGTCPVCHQHVVYP